MVGPTNVARQSALVAIVLSSTVLCIDAHAALLARI